MRLVRPFEILFLLGILTVATAVSAWLAILSPDALLRDPLPLYRQGAERSSPEIADGRSIHHLHLVDPDDQIVPFTLSLPAKMPNDPIPAIIVIGGFPGGPDPIAAVARPGPNAIIYYQPPFRKDENVLASFPFGAWHARSVIYRMPDEVAAILAWTGRQDWVERKHINLVGAGLGAAILPAIRLRAAATGQTVDATVFIGGGADLESLADANFHIRPAWLRHAVAWFSALILHPLSPQTHLREVSGPFLLVNLPDDPAIPAKARLALETLTPPPKTDAAVPRGNGTADDYVNRIVRVVQNWLIAKGAINP